MGDVIHVEFGKKNVECQQRVPGEDPILTAYLDWLR